ncbi:RDD family protein [Pelobacter seleniigenes]|uniref:RDD family protein n=1 Tax=Pelobacter seleniigenes TaxID=407188 RepID=UPI0004A7268B|nr:RDD family protein [Pelobacter seleniigenes]
MRCPKCGFNSFDYLDNCKKCGKDLVEFKERYGIKSVLFPGQTVAGETAVETDFDADAAVAAATASVAAAPVFETSPEPEAPTAESDDFGFDFMGDSTEDDDLSFDELFEEAPEDEDVEETLEGPKAKAEATDSTDFSFDLPEEDDLEDDFGFDPDEDSATNAAKKEPGKDPADPFDFPESSAAEGTPDAESTADLFDLTQNEAEALLDESPAMLTDSFAVAEEQDDLFSVAEEIPVEPDAELALDEPDLAPTPVVSAPAEVRDEEAVYAEYYRQFDELAEQLASVDEEVTASPLAATAVLDDSDEAIDDEVSVLATEELDTAGLGKRLLAGFCDIIVLAVVGGSFVIAAEAAMGGVNDQLLPSVTTLLDLSIPYFLVLFSLFFGYFTLFHFLAGQTPGKMLTGLRVETIGGDALDFPHAFLHTVGGLLQLLPAGLGYLSVFANPQRRGWNDRLAGTRVINLKR